MTNEPVAWMHTNSKQLFATTIPSKRDLHLFTPLYTHPMRELSDEKIWKLWQTHLNDDITVFARAILKKAREK